MIIMLCLHLQWLTRRQAHLLRAQQGIPISEFGVSVDKHIVYFHLLILYSVMVGVLYFNAQPFFLIFSHRHPHLYVMAVFVVGIKFLMNIHLILP